MPDLQTELKRALDELRQTHEQFKEKADRANEELKKRGEETAETREALAKINPVLDELKKSYEELRAEISRPSLETMRPGQTRKDKESPEHTSGFEKYLRYGFGEIGRGMMTPEEVRALSGVSDEDGGILVPPTFENDVIVKAYDQAELRPICNVGTTGRDTVVFPALGKATVAWGTTSLAVSDQTLKAGNERMTIYDLRALVRTSNNTLEDAQADIASELNMMFSDAIAEAEDDAFAVGTSENTPQGVVAWADVQSNYTLSGVAAALSDSTHNGVDALIGALYTLMKTYRRNATWAFNSTTEAAIRKLKDDNGQYLWQPPVQASSPATLLGRPMVNPEGMADIGAGAFPIVVGDFRKGYKIRDRSGLVVKRLVERYAEYDQTGFLVKRRVGGMPVLAEAFACVKIAAS